MAGSKIDHSHRYFSVLIQDMSVEVEPVAAKALKQWLSKHGGGFHKDVMIVEGEVRPRFVIDPDV